MSESFFVLRHGKGTEFLPVVINDFTPQKRPRNGVRRLQLDVTVQPGSSFVENVVPHDFLVFADACEENGLSGPILDMLKRLGRIQPEAEPIEYEVPALPTELAYALEELLPFDGVRIPVHAIRDRQAVSGTDFASSLFDLFGEMQMRPDTAVVAEYIPDADAFDVRPTEGDFGAVKWITHGYAFQDRPTAQ